MEKIINNLTAYLWLVLGVICLAGVLFFGAWWHLASAGFCLLLYRLFSDGSKRER